MTTVLCAVIFIVSVLFALIFGSTAWACLIVAAAAAALLVLKLFVFKNSKWMKVAAPCLGTALLVVCLFIGTSATDYGYRDYESLYSDLWDGYTEGKAEEVKAAEDAIAEKYGETDGMRYLRASHAVAEEDVEAAKEAADSFENKTSVYYYNISEGIILLEHPDDAGGYLNDLYIKEVKDNPDSVYALKMAGMTYLDRKDYTKSTYYLTKAYVNDLSGDGEIPYMLGCSLYEQGHHDKAFVLFADALDLGVDEKAQDLIAWYWLQSGSGGEES